MRTNYFRPLVLSALLLVIGCTSVADWGPPPDFSIPSNDVIAIGKLKNLASEPGQVDPDDLLGHGWFSADFHISRIEAGKLANKVIPVRYFGHTWLSEDMEFRFRLRSTESGGYIICKKPGSSGYNCDWEEGL